ncbi:GNAT family N-acetyltransferase [Alkalilacustris brevis]|uniref:GNAT family N-acetyltransferase n=1 Tax=Alkalilacustris brevis TaxID=2026338 RepID=UPI000E0D308C|nr:GNAT family N-acetyltransferase [Alkalilacustris brevis]
MTAGAGGAAVTLAPYAPARHRDLLAAWVEAPHVARWWGPPEARREIVAEAPLEHGALIEMDGRPVGYICWQRPTQAELAEAGLESLRTDMRDPDALIDIDLCIGEAAALGQGAGSAALRQLAERLLAEGFERLMLATSVENAATQRAARRAGFRPARRFCEDWYGEMWLFLRDAEAG